MFRARYYDGTHATAQNAKIEVYTSRIHISVSHTESAGSTTTWMYEDIMPASNPADGLPIRLSHRKQPAARLEITDPALWQALRGPLGNHKRLGRHIPFSGPLLAGLAALTLLVISALYQSMPHLSDLLAPLVPNSVRTELSGHALEELGVAGKRCSAPAGMAALEQLTRRLSAAARMESPAQVFVVRHKSINAFALPDGRIVIFSGLLKNAAGPDELAGVMAHEIGHVMEDHPAEGLVQALGIRLLLLVMTGSGDTLDARTLADWLLQTSYRRDKEREADRIAIGLLRQANISTHGFVAFFQDQAKENLLEGGMASYFSTHPKNSDRIHMIQELGSQSDGQHPPALSTRQWKDLQRICAHMEK